jgi:hypothetical protein
MIFPSAVLFCLIGTSILLILVVVIRPSITASREGKIVAFLALASGADSCRATGNRCAVSSAEPQQIMSNLAFISMSMYVIVYNRPARQGAVGLGHSAGLGSVGASPHTMDSFMHITSSAKMAAVTVLAIFAIGPIPLTWGEESGSASSENYGESNAEPSSDEMPREINCLNKDKAVARRSSDERCAVPGPH